MDVEGPRGRLRRQAELLTRIAENEELFDELVHARRDGDPVAFRAAIDRIPLPDSVDARWFCLRTCEELDKVYLVAVERLVWSDSGRPFNEAAARANLEAQKGAPPISDEVWAAFVQWLVDEGVLRIETTLRPDPDLPTPVKCSQLCLGGPPRPIPR